MQTPVQSVRPRMAHNVPPYRHEPESTSQLPTSASLPELALYHRPHLHAQAGCLGVSSRGLQRGEVADPPCAEARAAVLDRRPLHTPLTWSFARLDGLDGHELARHGVLRQRRVGGMAPTATSKPVAVTWQLLII